ncbi:MAG TPA: hypothetical protein ENL06_01265 [Candidatus Portnoybacteria bacterium]|nr:hypothetical protein [Candidatus Portnoybacteria bacterium]
MSQTKIQLDWSPVEKFLREGTEAGYLMSIIEAEKLFRDFLVQNGFKIRNWQRINKLLKQFVSQPEKFSQARRTYYQIIQEPLFKINTEETKGIIKNYWQAIIDLDEAINCLSLREKIWLKIKCFLAL